jgi:hypothetical protein
VQIAQLFYNWSIQLFSFAAVIKNDKAYRLAFSFFYYAVFKDQGDWQDVKTSIRVSPCSTSCVVVLPVSLTAMS